MKKKTKKLLLVTIPLILASIGAVNWGLVGSLNLNIVTAIFQSMPWLVTTIYTIVGVSGILGLIKAFGGFKKLN